MVTIADGLSKLEEVDQFYVINTTQKKVRTDLARRLKTIQMKDIEHKLTLDQQGRLWEARGPIVADRMNRSPGVWQGRILPPNRTKAEQPTMIIRETSFVTSLQPILQTPYFVRQTEDHAAGLLGTYWEAISRLFPEAFSTPDDYVIQKTPGVFAFHTIAPEVFEMARDQGEIALEQILGILNSLRGDLDSKFWSTHNEDGAARYGSMKGFRILASLLRQRLPDAHIA